VKAPRSYTGKFLAPVLAKGTGENGSVARIRRRSDRRRYNRGCSSAELPTTHNPGITEIESSSVTEELSKK